MDCGTYIEHFLSAHVDGELAGEELRQAEEHLAGCAECRERFQEERALKKLLHDHFATLKTPTDVRERIRLALDREQPAAVRIEGGPAIRGALRSRWLRPQVWIPAAIAALLIIGLTKLRPVTAPPQQIAEPQETELQQAAATGSIPMFDVAARHLDRFDAKFEPNVPSSSPADISDAYLGHQMPGYLWNFGPAGYQLAGGRLEPVSNGQMAAFTYYRGEKGGILCTYMHSPGELPPGAIHQTDAHAYYEYKGYSICVSKYPHGNFVCILITRRPLPEFMETIAASSL